MGCRKLDIRSQFYFVGAEEKPHSHEETADYTQKTAYSRFSHTVISNYRYYSPELGRWLSRDPIGERGGVNLFAMTENDPINKWDRLGLGTFWIQIQKKQKPGDSTVNIRFLPTDEEKKCCVNIAFKQFATSFAFDINQNEKIRKKGWNKPHIDSKTGTYPYYHPVDPNNPTTQPSMDDDPYIPGGGIQYFTTHAICVEGKNPCWTGRDLGSIRWTVIYREGEDPGFIVEGKEMDKPIRKFTPTPPFPPPLKMGITLPRHRTSPIPNLPPNILGAPPIGNTGLRM